MRLTLLLAASTVLAASGQAQVICVDPGHPSENGNGTRGAKISELHADWVVAQKLANRLRAEGYKVVLTEQHENQVVSNRSRAEIANSASADLMVRLHCDAGSGSGFACYYPARQGKAGGVTGPSKKVLVDSLTKAKAFHDAMAEALEGIHKDRGLHTDADTMIGGRQGGALTGSVFSKVPVVLVEMAVLQNKSDDEFMASERGQDLIAAALAKGVEAAVPRRS